MGFNVVDAILGRQQPAGQPVIGLPTPPQSGPGSGYAPPNLDTKIATAPPGAFSPVAGAVCISIGEIMRRRSFRRYVGPTFTSGVGKVFPWVLSDDVPPNKYWILFDATVLSGPAWAGPDFEPDLYLLPSIGQRPNPRILDGTDPFFGDYSTVVQQNYGPPVVGLRIDDGGNNASTSEGTIQVAGQELKMLKSTRYVLMGPGETLMGYAANNAAAPNNSPQIELRIVIVEMDFSEYFASL